MNGILKTDRCDNPKSSVWCTRNRSAVEARSFPTERYLFRPLILALGIASATDLEGQLPKAEREPQSGSVSLPLAADTIIWAGQVPLNRRLVIRGSFNAEVSTSTDSIATVRALVKVGRGDRQAHDLRYEVQTTDTLVLICVALPRRKSYERPGECAPRRPSVREPHEAAIDVRLVVSLPTDSRLQVLTLGDIDARDVLSDSVSLETVGGRVRVRTTRSVYAYSLGGDIHVRIPDSTWVGSLNLSSGAGDIVVVLWPTLNPIFLTKARVGGVRIDPSLRRSDASQISTSSAVRPKGRIEARSKLGSVSIRPIVPCNDEPFCEKSGATIKRESH